jgi:hypothetical protein
VSILDGALREHELADMRFRDTKTGGGRPYRKPPAARELVMAARAFDLDARRTGITLLS